MPSAVLASLGALLFGSADFLGGLAAKRLRSIVVTAVAAVSGLLALLIALPLIGGTWTATDVGWGALSGVFGVFSIALLYACLAIGPMSILSPLTAVVSAVAPLLWGVIVDREQLSAIAWIGIMIALVAVVLVGFLPGEKVVRPSVRGVLMAVGSGISIGAFMVTIDQTTHESGLVPLVVNRGTNALITGAIVAGMLVLALRRASSSIPPRAVMARALTPGSVELGATPSGRADLEQAQTAPAPILRTSATPALLRGLWLAVACGTVDATANALMLVGLRLGDLSIVSVLTAMYPAGTILLAALLLRERIAPVQWVGLALALTAGILFALS